MSKKLSTTRLAKERKDWRKDHPAGFYAKPKKNPDSSTNLLHWTCGIPGKEGTEWAGGMYKIRLEFSEDYPSVPPKAVFDPVIFHPNIYPSGTVCLSILAEDKDWKPSITVKQILLGVQDLLDSPNNDDPAQSAASALLKRSPADYSRKLKEQALLFTPK